MQDVNFKDLETRGFVLIPSFLSEEELAFCREDYAQQPVDANNHNYGLSTTSQKTAERLLGRVQEVLALVLSHTNLRTDIALGGAYFATGRKIRFPWHQDHESFFTIQNHYDYLNFYMPIVKPRRDRSNLTIVPFDVLERESPRLFRKVVRGGATRFRPVGERSVIYLDDVGSVHLVKANLSRMATTPLLDPGDLLLLRGDVIHQTQDTETERVALSFRAASSKTLVRRSRLAAGGLHKARMMANNAATYEPMFKAFDEAGKNAMGMLEFYQVLGRTTAAAPERPRKFFNYLLWQKHREHVLVPFVRSILTTKFASLMCLLYERRHGSPVAGSRTAYAGPNFPGTT